ncbi:Anaerobic nitric oxide reductase flavorubredoxin [Peptoniphilus sp. ING2-D1G]|nr:Anaerobic nitric oxide reductase flavorubredoxin [Peptoniphilus sp. ING2-D1G]
MRRKISENVSWIGFIDWELKKFHGDEYSIINGSSQNAYLIEEEKTVLVDTVWSPHRFEFIENLKSEIDLNKIDYIIVNHGEVDHSGALRDLLKEIPGTPLYCTANCVKSLEGQYGKLDWNFNVVKTGDRLDIGNGKELIFIEMKMLHWPDSMATFMTGNNLLFSMDAFGQHFAAEELFNDLVDEELMYKEAMKYFANIIHPFAPFVTRKIKEIEDMNLDIEMIAPSHGAIWRDNPMQIVEKYKEWAGDYKEDRIVIAYDTMWEGTTEIANKIAYEINKRSPETVVKVFNVSKYDKNEIMTEVFRAKAIVVGSPTEINDILSSVAEWIHFLKSLKFKGKKAAAFGTYGWSGESVKILQEQLKDAGFDVIDEFVKANWRMNEENEAQVEKMVEALLKDL